MLEILQHLPIRDRVRRVAYDRQSYGHALGIVTREGALLCAGCVAADLAAIEEATAEVGSDPDREAVAAFCVIEEGAWCDCCGGHLSA